jgi:hypothetical protein
MVAIQAYLTLACVVIYYNTAAVYVNILNNVHDVTELAFVMIFHPVYLFVKLTWLVPRIWDLTDTHNGWSYAEACPQAVREIFYGEPTWDYD